MKDLIVSHSFEFVIKITITANELKEYRKL